MVWEYAYSFFKSKSITFLVFIALVFNSSGCTFAKTPGAGYIHSCEFSFSLKSTLRTSAGVYAKDGTLIKTLWSGVTYNTGIHKQVWDGTTDDGGLAPAGDYNIKVLTNNVKYTWEGVIGNTSDSVTGHNLHRAHNNAQALAIAGSNVYYTTGYNEQGSSTFSFNSLKPQSRSIINSRGFVATQVATDGQNVYWAGKDANDNQSFVFASQVNNDSLVRFATSKLYKTRHGITFNNVIDLTSRANTMASGLAVQGKGKFLLISYRSLNQIHVFDKGTGASVISNTITEPAAIAADAHNHLWVTYKENNALVVGKYTIDEGGRLKSLGVSLPGLVQPLAMAISPDENYILVADGGNSQQLKAYNTTTGQLLWAYGQKGGYAFDATVQNDKFYFSDKRGITGAAIAFAGDGSFWVGDSGNSRMLHYSATRKYIDGVMYLPTSYCMGVDANDISRVFSDYLEFHVDYTKPLMPNNGSWQLVKNWGAMVPADLDNKYFRLKGVVTLKNGHTYAMQSSKAIHGWTICELMPHGALRVTNAEVTDDSYRIYPDGGLYKMSKYVLGAPVVWTKKPLTGFDQDNNPQWGSEVVLASSPPANNDDPYFRGKDVVLRPGEITTSNVVVSFDATRYPFGSAGWHLGGIKNGTNKWLWRTAMGTPANYRGDFPADGAFDNGNSVRYAGSVAMAIDHHIFWGYYGEFWKASETNKWNDVNDDGLFIGQFGITGPEVKGGGVDAVPMMAGNAFCPAVVKAENGDIYLYHNDEGAHSGVHRWKVSNLGSIEEQQIPVSLSYKQHGLLCHIFSSNDLNNLNSVYTNVVPSASFVIPPNLKGAQKNLCSVSFTGFIKAPVSSAYTFYAGSNYLRLWVNDKLITDSWYNKASGEKSIPINLVANHLYAIRIEYRGVTASTTMALSWANTVDGKQQIPGDSLIPAENTDRNSFDLLEGLPYDAVLENDAYGWARDAVKEDSTNRNSNFWSVHTNVKTYGKQNSPDLHMSFREPNAINTVTRDLGNSANCAGPWKLAALLNYENNMPNTDKDMSANGAGGSFFEVLDDKGKVIIRFFFHTNAANEACVYVNNKVIFKTDKIAIRDILNATNWLDINMKDGIAAVKYANYTPVNVPVFDSAANWAHPQKLRVYFWCKNQNAPRALDIEKLYYTTMCK